MLHTGVRVPISAHSGFALSWDKDLLGKEYLGEVSLSVEDWFKNRAIAFDDANNSVRPQFELTSPIIGID